MGVNENKERGRLRGNFNLNGAHILFSFYYFISFGILDVWFDTNSGRVSRGESKPKPLGSNRRDLDSYPFHISKLDSWLE